MERKKRILAVDDEEMNRALLTEMLLPLGYDVETASDGREAIERAESWSPDVILLDVMMPRMNGFDAARYLKNHETTSGIPIVIVTALNEVKDRVTALQAGADDFLTKPIDRTELTARVQSLLKVKAYNDYMRRHQKELEDEVAQRTTDLKQALHAIKTASLETIVRLSRAAECKDGETYGHIWRMSQYSAAIARKLGLPDEIVETILYSTPMHDVGKIGIPDYILLKPGKLTESEEQVMRQHTVFGARILENSDAELIHYAEVIALTHHEKWDGTGYPHKLQGTDIPIAGRIAACADVFDALNSARPYKRPVAMPEALEIVRGGRGTQFDPDIVDAFLACRHEIEELFERSKDFHEPPLF